MAWAIGLDIGGTKIAAGLVGATGSVTGRIEAPAPHDARGVEQAALALARQVLDEQDSPQIEAVGVGSPGTIDPISGKVTASDSKPALVGANVGEVLGQALGVPYAVTNDVNAAGVGELAYGVAAGFSRVLVVAAGTGIGGALLINGRLEEGMSGTTGEIAHLLVPQAGAGVCGCGKRDHLEAVASGPAIEAEYAAATGERRTAREIARIAADGNPTASTTIDAAATTLGRCVAGLANAVDIDALVITGGVADIERYFAAAKTAFSDEVMVPLNGVPVLRSALGADAPIVGAATYVRARLGI
ncbi:ROK family protein [Epidermidibacterium keratini]|uniref:ROK family protein n=1 Tax=Epidermidibacterium keratini TaxID=1891644 RepID=A0A7L4YPA1_9ACTN|nr:ROK family protein [Epidermidibacterium keratini]QHC01111.1 ROK family protein [Epidermidibacterium keratini]